MYYGNDSEGNIVMSDSSDILPDEFQAVFPDSASDTVSAGDFSTPAPTDLTDSFIPVFPDDYVSYEDMVDLLALVPGYNVYPSAAAVSVFEDVLNGLPRNIGYVILSGSDTYSTYLYYSDKYSVSGSSVFLSSPVTFCTYYQYRPTTSSSWVYIYTVNTIGDTSFNISNQLVYTNLLEGYPDVLPYKQKETYSLFYIIAFSLLVLFLIFVIRVRGGRR